MSDRVRIEVLCAPGSPPDAIFYPGNVLPASHEGDVKIASSFRDLRLFGRIGARLLNTGDDTLFDAKLSLRWGCMVACKPEFATWWHTRVGRPQGFFLEVFA